jgi:hypothetical protein
MLIKAQETASGLWTSGAEYGNQLSKRQLCELRHARELPLAQ